MKKLWILLHLPALLCACISEEITKKTEYRIFKNDSNHIIDIAVSANEDFSFHLNPQDSIVLKGYCAYSGGGDHCVIGWSDSSPISGQIIFDNQKVLNYENSICENGRNPFVENPFISECGYHRRNRDNHQEHIYTFTEEDYQNAEPL